MENTKTLKECLTLLAISQEELENLNLQSQFALIKEKYHDLIRQTHPDKNPTLDGSMFREVRACFNVLKKKYSENKELKDFTFAIFFENGAVAENFEGYLNGNVPSWDFYEAAEAVEMPRYCVEPAKSGRSKCKKCKENIEKGDIRIGGIMEDYGTYSRWNHLNCWRIPERIWSTLSDENNADTVLSELLEMDELVLTGLNVLEHSDQEDIVACVRDSSKWASYSKKKQKDREARLKSEREAMEADVSKPAAVNEPDDNEDDRKPAAKQDNETESSTMDVDESAAKDASTETNVVSSQDSTNNETHTFEIPIPGKNGCLVDKLKDKVFVISGSFGDLGNGKGRGTTKARAVVESFGGTVRKAISGNTDYLLLGSRANCKTVAKGKEMSNVTLISAISLQKLLLNKIGFESLSLEGITEHDSNECDKENKRPASESDEGAKKPAAKRQKTDALVEATSASVSAIDLPKEKKQTFEIPVPGKEGAIQNALNGKIFVLTGVFPELGGGAGLTLGKNKCTTMIESFGGVVRSSISGKTNYLVVGKEPGLSKYNQAKAKGLPMLDLRELRRLMFGETTLEAIDENPPQLQIQKFCDIASRKRIVEW